MRVWDETQNFTKYFLNFEEFLLNHHKILSFLFQKLGGGVNTDWEDNCPPMPLW